MTGLSPVAFYHGSASNGSVITVPSGVTRSHLGIAVLASSSAYSHASVPSMSGWQSLATDPSIANQMEWNLLSRKGGVQAGDQITVNVAGGSTFAVYIAWYDTSGIGTNIDVATVGTVGGRGTTNSSQIIFPAVSPQASGQTIVVVASDKSAATGTAITSWTGSYAPTADYAAEDVTGTNTSAYFGHFTVTGAGSTGTLTANYNEASANGVGVMLILGYPATANFLDPFTNQNWDGTGTQPDGAWTSGCTNTLLTMANGLMSMPFTNDNSSYMWPGEGLNFNNSTFNAEVWLEDTTFGSFAMWLTDSAVPSQERNGVYCGITQGGNLFFNERIYNGGTPINNNTTYSTIIAANTPVCLRLRNTGTTTVYFDVSYDGTTWTNVGSRVITCFNPATAVVTPYFKALSNSGMHTDKHAVVSNMNTSGFSTPFVPWHAVTLWSYWDGTQEVALNPADAWNWYTPANDPGGVGVVLVSPNTYASPNIYPEADSNPYPATNIYPDGDYPSADNYPGEQKPSSTDYPSSTNYPGAQSYPDFGNIYPGG